MNRGRIPKVLAVQKVRIEPQPHVPLHLAHQRGIECGTEIRGFYMDGLNRLTDVGADRLITQFDGRTGFQFDDFPSHQIGRAHV